MTLRRALVAWLPALIAVGNADVARAAMTDCSLVDGQGKVTLDNAAGTATFTATPIYITGSTHIAQDREIVIGKQFDALKLRNGPLIVVWDQNIHVSALMTIGRFRNCRSSQSWRTSASSKPSGKNSNR